jgi:hypothetical protein
MLGLVFITEWASLVSIIEGLGGLAVLAGVYHLVECHEGGCHKFGRYRLGHLKLCGDHHPEVPEGGVDAAHVAETHEKLNA